MILAFDDRLTLAPVSPFDHQFWDPWLLPIPLGHALILRSYKCCSGIFTAEVLPRDAALKSY